MLERLVGALNSLAQPWLAITVILLGMTFDIVCKHFSVPNDAATGVIGAGVGLLTGQALASRPGQHISMDTNPSPLAPAPEAAQNGKPK